MTPLHWQEVPTKNGTHIARSQSITAESPKGAPGVIVGIIGSAAFSFLLMGLIVGYILGNVLHR